MIAQEDKGSLAAQYTIVMKFSDMNLKLLQILTLSSVLLTHPFIKDLISFFFYTLFQSYTVGVEGRRPGFTDSCLVWIVAVQQYL